MTTYAFYANFLLFVARRTERADDDVSAMMDALETIAAQVATGPVYHVAPDRLRLAARALAGVAGFLQQHILPEAAAAGDATAQTHVRWVIDASMEAMAHLTTQAELGHDRPVEVVLPEPPPEA